MERTLDIELSELNDMILKMGNMAETAIAKSIDALRNRDDKLSLEIVEEDKRIDELENEIDDKCVTLIATKQPMAVDLRFITTAMKICTDIERIGDLAVDVAEKNLELVNYPLLKPLIDTPKLADIAKKMINMSINAFVSRDAGLTLSLRDLEKESDKLRNVICDKLADMMEKDPANIPRALPLFLIARFLERACDHSMNIAENIVFMVEGRVIKHLHVK